MQEGPPLQGPARLSSPYRALVKATLSRLGSFKNPMPWCSLARTQERMIKSFSRPWNASTLAISTSYRCNNHGQPTGFLQGALSPHKVYQNAPDDGDRVSCHGLGDHFGILCDGTVVPCCLDSDGMISLGNIFQEELSDILSSPRAKAIADGFRQRKAVESLCRRCGYATRF